MWPLVLFLAACRIDDRSLARPPTGTPPVALPASPPPAPRVEGEKLYQLLYAEELGDAARPSGQRARMLVWMDAVALTPAQLTTLRDIIAEVRAAQAAHDAQRAAAGEAERAGYVPVHEALIRALANGGSAASLDLAALAGRLEAAAPSKDPRADAYARVASLFPIVQKWIESLSADQQKVLGQSRFFLARRLSAYHAPGDYSAFVGSAWDGGDFGSLRATLRPDAEGHLDVGGLWATEQFFGSPDHDLRGYQLAVLVLFAVQEPGLDEAIEVRLGLREPMDFGAP